MMSFMINGVEESTESCTLLDVLRQKEIQQDRVVLELNETIVKRPLWGETLLKEGDKLEIVCFVGGG